MKGILRDAFFVEMKTPCHANVGFKDNFEHGLRRC